MQKIFAKDVHLKMLQNRVEIDYDTYEEFYNFKISSKWRANYFEFQQ